jgi:hypothetical protein
MWQVRRKKEAYTEFYYGNLKQLLGRPMRTFEDNIKMNLKEIGRRGWTEFMWLRTETRAGTCNTVIDIRITKNRGGGIT